MGLEQVEHRVVGCEAPPPQSMPVKYQDSHHRTDGKSPHGDQRWTHRLMVWGMPFIPKPIIRFFAQRYVAGETVAEMLTTVEKLNQRGVMATIDVLGEFITDLKPADETARIYGQILDELQARGLNANISVKLTALGLLIDAEYCYQLMDKLVAQAKAHNNFVRIDMEDTPCTDLTIDLYLRLRKTYDNVGIVMQAYLRRTHSDVNRIIDAGAGHFRLCKGIYVEPRWHAYQMPDLVNQNYLTVLETMIQRGAYIGIATHDERLVWGALQLIRRYNLSVDQYEFQMLLGVDPELRDLLVAAGHRVRIYVPFGKKWHGYSMRRLKENPKIAGYILKNILRPDD